MIFEACAAASILFGILCDLVSEGTREMERARGGGEEDKEKKRMGRRKGKKRGDGIYLPLLVASSNKAVSTACPGKCT